jgi:hypothetical protein
VDNFSAYAFPIVVIGGWTCYAIYWAIRKAVSKRRQKKLDEMAFAMFGGFDFEKAKAEIESINAQCGFTREKKERLKPMVTYKPYWKRCPSCGGQLTIIEGKSGALLTCNNYPNCKYAENL